MTDSKAPGVPGPSSSGQFVILVVDDEEMIRFLITSRLQGHGRGVQDHDRACPSLRRHEEQVAQLMASESKNRMPSNAGTRRSLTPRN